MIPYLIPTTFRQEVLTRLLIDLFLSRKKTDHDKTQSLDSKSRPCTDMLDNAHPEQSNEISEALREESDEKDN